MNQIKAKEMSESSFNPVLKTALSSLDLDLESELSRYRRFKKKNSPHSNYKPSIPQVIPVESLDLAEIVGLVHQPDEGLTTTHDQEISPPEDYLESSARLLQSLGNSEVLGDHERALLNPIKTPWGISSVLMLFLGCGLSGLAFMPQTIWAKVPLVKSLVITDSNLPNYSPQKKEIPVDNPNLTESEFLSFNLNNLSTLKVKNKQQSAIKPPEKKAVIPPNPTENKAQPQPTPNQDLATALLAPVLNQITPQPQTDTYNTKANSSSTQLNKNYYYVFTEYKGDQTLATARQVIKDAYLVQFPTGKRIQFGAFLNQADAQRLVQSLKSRGISASVYNN